MKLSLQTRILLGMALGVVVGHFLGDFSLAVLSPVGGVFVRALKMLIGPLVLASIVVGVGGMKDLRAFGKLGGTTLAYFAASTVVAVVIGLGMAAVIAPGTDSGITLQASAAEASKAASVSVVDTLVRIVPKNFFAALAQDDMLAIIFMAVLVGAALASLGSRGQALYAVFESANALMMRLVDWIMRLAPYGVLALIASTVAEVGLDAFRPLALYVLTVALGLAAHALLVVPLVLFILGRHSPRRLFADISTALATVFSTASSAAAMPVAMERLIAATGLPTRVVSFLMPLGTTMNMNGTALYQGVAVLFFAQLYGIDLGPAEIAIVVLTATLAAVAAAAVPSAGFITMTMIMHAVGLPVDQIGLILGVDRIVDMLRSSVNLWSNSAGAVIVSRLQRE